VIGINLGLLEGIVIASIFIGLFVWGGAYIYADFGNNYGFSNETDSRFNELINTTEVYGYVELAKEDALDINDDPTVTAIELVFKGGYFAIRNFFNLPNTLTAMAGNALSIFGVPAEVNNYLFAIISVLVLFGVLYGLGVLKRG